MPRMLELFCGRNKSVSKVFEEAGWDCMTLDIDPKADAYFPEDILKWEFMHLPIGHFDYIHASPPCVEFSRAKMGERDLATADALVTRTLFIIARFKPKFWTIENPWGTAQCSLRTRPVMGSLDWALKKCCYCRYAPEWGYQKATSVHCNLDNWTPKVCDKDERCSCYVNGRHPKMAQHGQLDGTNISTTELHRIPRLLVEDWLAAMQDAVSTDAASVASAASAASVASSVGGP